MRNEDYWFAEYGRLNARLPRLLLALGPSGFKLVALLPFD